MLNSELSFSNSGKSNNIGESGRLKIAWKAQMYRGTYYSYVFITLSNVENCLYEILSLLFLSRNRNPVSHYKGDK